MFSGGFRPTIIGRKGARPKAESSLDIHAFFVCFNTSNHDRDNHSYTTKRARELMSPFIHFAIIIMERLRRKWSSRARVGHVNEGG